MRLIFLIASGLIAAPAAPTLAQGNAATFVAIGCVAAAVHDGSLAGSPGVPPANANLAPVLANSSEPTGAFVLNGATPPAAPGTAAPKSGETKHTYALDGDVRQFMPHVGHRVEVTGQLTQGRTGSTPQDSTPVDHIRVTSVKMINGECPQPGQRK